MIESGIALSMITIPAHYCQSGGHRARYLAAGCNTPDAAPLPGDVRLVDLEDTPSGTTPCDEVHFGGVEVFSNGQWGAICSFGSTDLPKEATVVCSQLGFPFGSVFNVEETYEDAFGLSVPPFPSDDTIPSSLSWGRVTCNGTAQRLDECSFSSSSDGTFAGLEEQSNSCFVILGVVCHRFELTGAASCKLATQWVLLIPVKCKTNSVVMLLSCFCHVAVAYTLTSQPLQSLREMRSHLCPRHCLPLHHHHRRLCEWLRGTDTWRPAAPMTHIGGLGREWPGPHTPPSTSTA